MGSHIDFVEKCTYDNVNSYIYVRKSKGLTGSSGDQYTLTDLEDKDEVD